MSSTNVKIIFVAAIGMVLWGGFNFAKATYTSFAWTKADGKVIDFEHNVWSCGKGVGECYSLIIDYAAGNKHFTITSKKKFNYDKPTHLLNEKVTVYYSPNNPGEAVISGSYGTGQYGAILFLIGLVILFVFWVINKREK